VKTCEWRAAVDDKLAVDSDMVHMVRRQVGRLVLRTRRQAARTYQRISIVAACGIRLTLRVFCEKFGILPCAAVAAR
jgi:hypothetical protein